LWGLHPLRVEVVGWATQFCFAGATFFSLLTILFYFRACRQNLAAPARTLWWYGAIAAFLLSGLFFASGVGVAVLLILLDVLVVRRFPIAAIRLKDVLRITIEKWPFLLIALVIGLVTIYGRVNARGIWAGVGNVLPFTASMQAAYVFAY